MSRDDLEETGNNEGDGDSERVGVNGRRVIGPQDWYSGENEAME